MIKTLIIPFKCCRHVIVSLLMAKFDNNTSKDSDNNNDKDSSKCSDKNDDTSIHLDIDNDILLLDVLIDNGLNEYQNSL